MQGLTALCSAIYSDFCLVVFHRKRENLERILNYFVAKQIKNFENTVQESCSKYSERYIRRFV